MIARILFWFQKIFAKKKQSPEEYAQFLEEYWKMFPMPPREKMDKTDNIRF